MRTQEFAISYWTVDAQWNITGCDQFSTVLATDFDPAIAKRMVDHMNEDHTDTLVNYCEAAKITLADELIRMVDVDAESFLLQTKKCHIRFFFESQCSTSVDVRNQLVKMAKSSRMQLSKKE